MIDYNFPVRRLFFEIDFIGHEKRTENWLSVWLSLKGFSGRRNSDKLKFITPTSSNVS